MRRRATDPYTAASDRVLRWCALYTRGLPEAVAKERRDELLSDLHEQREDADARPAAQRALGRAIQGRAVRGVLSDLSWRSAQLRQAPLEVRGGVSTRAPMGRLLAASYVIGSLIAWASAFSAVHATGLSNSMLVHPGEYFSVASVVALTALVLLSRPRMRAIGAVLLGLIAVPAWWLFLTVPVSWTLSVLSDSLVPNSIPFLGRLLLALSPAALVSLFFFAVALTGARSAPGRRRTSYRNRPPRLREVLAAATALALVAVGGGIAAAASAATVDRRPSSDSAELASDAEFHGILPVPDPLEPYGQSAEDYVAEVHAENILTAACMERLGYPYPGQDIDALAQSFPESEGRLYGITDAQVASVYGFLTKPSHPMRTLTAVEQSDDYAYALTGLRPGESRPIERATSGAGCLGDARAQLTGDVSGSRPDDATLGSNLQLQAWEDMWTTPSAVQAKADWSRCMAESGYHVADPLSDQRAPALLGAAGDDQSVSQPEIDQALTDIRCKVSTKFVERVGAIQADLAARFIEQNADRLAPSKAFNDSVLAKSEAVIAAATAPAS
jgi:hypothetical protein